MSDIAYEMPWRPNYEAWAVASWAGGAGLALAVDYFSGMPSTPFYWMAGISTAMGMSQLPKAVRLYTLNKHLAGRKLEFIKLAKLQKIMKKHQSSMWLGYGFHWETRHVQRVFEILKRDRSAIMPTPKDDDGDLQMGQKWIHGVEPKEKRLFQPLKHSEGHTLIVGTTGAGKTRMFDHLISQCILRGEPVFVIDPKGDKELQANARRACEAIGEGDKFVNFHPAFPEDSVRMDPLRNYNEVSEIATRIATLIQSEGNDPFVSFSWQALNNIAQGLVMTYQRPTLRNLRRFLEGGSAGLVSTAISAYSDQYLDRWEEKAQPYLDRVKNKSSVQQHAQALVRFYQDVVQPVHPNAELEGLISMFTHDSTHFSKMVTSLMPILNMLTSGSLGKLLSPNADDPEDERDITDTSKIIKLNQVAYVGLNSLSNGMVGSALGSIMLSDLTSVAGARYNYGDVPSREGGKASEQKIVNIFVDEAAEVINDPFIQLLNKGRGAKIRLFVATQTFADFAARLGSKDKTLQVLGNINNTIALRVKDTDTQEYVVTGLPPTRVKYVMRTQGQNTQSDQPIMHGGNQGERLMEEESELFPPSLLGMLPNLEFVANISGGQFIKGRIPILTE